MRVLVCGGRYFDDADHLARVLSLLHNETPISVLIHGDCTGADRLASIWAAQRSIPQTAFPADWKNNSRKAGPIRNHKMLSEGRPDLVVAFQGNRGTKHMMFIARKKGVRVLQEFGPALAPTEPVTCVDEGASGAGDSGNQVRATVTHRTRRLQDRGNTPTV